MARRFPTMILVGFLAAACGTAQPSANPAQTAPGQTSDIATEAPFPNGTATPATSAPPFATTPGPFDGQPYSLDLQDPWVIFDLSDPTGAAALDAFVAANPDMAGAIEAFAALPNVVMAVNQPVGHVVIALATPTGGRTLDAIAATFTTQFAAVPGVVAPPQPESITLPAGPAVYWDLTIEANNPGGGTSQIGESIYLVANDTTAVLVEFVEAGGVDMPGEPTIIRSLRFTP